jgi:hypothetical protein
VHRAGRDAGRDRSWTGQAVRCDHRTWGGLRGRTRSDCSAAATPAL